jgi:NAD(P)-dependent dehydrogenase (short-subunit alcohol dehydrogenase family)
MLIELTPICWSFCNQFKMPAEPRNSFAVAGRPTCHAFDENAMNAFQDKVVIVTGGSSGIGRSSAFQFAAAGAHVLITGRRAERLDEASQDHPHIEPVVADTSRPEDAFRTVSSAIERWGRLDVLVNNAGAGAIMPLAEVSADRITDIFAVNVLGPSLLAKEALPHLKGTKGSIINISSTYGSKAGAGLSHYGASKAALEYLTRAWALELAPAGIRVNAIAVGPTESGALTGMMGLTAEQAESVKQHEQKQIPLGRRGLPDEVARWILSFANPENEWVTGQIFGVDGGLGLT